MERYAFAASPSHWVGKPHRCFIIAEAGVNHNGDEALALKLVDAAADAGVDAVKFQTFSPAKLAAAGAPKASYQSANDPRHADQRSMLDALALSASAYPKLLERARARNILFLSSPFDEDSADLIEPWVPAFKIPSGEITNHPLIAHVSRKRKPMLVSTGMATLPEIASTLEVIRANGDPAVALFHCVSNYPAAPSECNLHAMSLLRATFRVPVGWSDHTSGDDLSLAAIALGAEILEKHFTLDRTLPGPDHKASLEPTELAGLVERSRRVEAALGEAVKAPSAAELEVARVVRKSLYWAHGQRKGVSAVESDFMCLRPGDGISPTRLRDFVGRILHRDVDVGVRVEESDFKDP